MIFRQSAHKKISSMSKGKNIFSGIAWTIIQNIINILYGLVSVPYLINYFGKDEYGLIGIALSVNVYVQLLDMGMTNSVVRFYSEYLEKKDNEKVQKLFSFTHLFYIVVGFINSLVLFIVSFYVDSLFNVTLEQGDILRNLLLILALNATFSWLSTCYDQLLFANEMISWTKKRMSFLKLLQFAILLGVIATKSSIEVYFFCYIFLSTFILPLSIRKIKVLLPNLHFDFKFDKKIVLSVFPYIISVFSFSVFQFIASSSRPILLGNMSGPASVAEFNVISTIASVVIIFTSTFTQVLLPVVSKMSVSNDRTGILNVVYKGSSYANYLISFVVFSIILSSNELLNLYVGDSFADINIWLVLWLLMLLLSHRNVMTSLVFAQSKLSSISKMGAFAMSVALIFYLIFIPKFSVGGVVIGYFAHEIIHTMFYYFYYFPRVLKIKTISFFFKKIFPVWLVASSTCFIINHLVNNGFCGDFELVIIKTLFFALIYILLVLFVLNKQKDRSELFYIVSRIIKK